MKALFLLLIAACIQSCTDEKSSGSKPQFVSKITATSPNARLNKVFKIYYDGMNRVSLINVMEGKETTNYRFGYNEDHSIKTFSNPLLGKTVVFKHNPGNGLLNGYSKNGIYYPIYYQRRTDSYRDDLSYYSTFSFESNGDIRTLNDFQFEYNSDKGAFANALGSCHFASIFGCDALFRLVSTKKTIKSYSDGSDSYTFAHTRNKSGYVEKSVVNNDYLTIKYEYKE